jgi:serine/threonine protein kinase/tetratricopeptide (TPR) repeat protein
VKRSERLKLIFQEAIALTPHERFEYVNASCVEDPSLAPDVHALLESYDQLEEFVDAPRPGGSTYSLLSDVERHFEPAFVRGRVGNYTIERLVGSGGTGNVYLAARTDGPSLKRYAVKVLHRRFADELVARQFAVEKEVLSRLDHPYIAKLIDSGVSDDGLPYLVMEYVDGCSIVEYCRAGSVSLRARLELFAKICEAVHYAHGLGVIHRDIKASNIIVEPDGTPRLLDFGIAKVLRVNANPTITATGLRALTPESAAPEQIRGESVGPATDVYALGVLLYRLVADRPPYEVDRRSPYQVVRTICEIEPIPPSKVSPNDSNLLRQNAHLGRDADRVVLKCLRKEPAGRYRSAQALLDDVRRLRAGVPVSARGGLLGHRAMKIVRQWRILAVLVLISVLAFYAFWPTPPSATSLAVIPFRNATGNGENDPLSDGLTDGLIARLVGLDGLSVPGRNTMFRYKNSTEAPNIIGRELNAENILTGTISAHGNEFGLQFTLVNAKTNRAIWNGQYVTRPANLLLTEQTIARDVADALAIPGIQPDGSVNGADVYLLYLKGRHYWYKRTPRDLQNSLTLLEQAAAENPKFDLAFSGIADCYVLLALHGAVPWTDGIEKARAAAGTALQLNPSSAEANVSMGAIHWLYDFDWEAADSRFRRAMAINPNSAAAHHWYGLYLAEMGRFDEAIASASRAVQLDPLSTIINADLGRVLYYSRRYDEALEQFCKTISIDESGGSNAFDAVFVYEQLGMQAEWFALMERAGAIKSHELRIAFANGGIRGFYKKRTQISERAGEPNGYALAEDYARIGEIDRAVDQLEIALARRSHGMAQLKVNPVLDPLRGNPRFNNVLLQMGFQP